MAGDAGAIDKSVQFVLLRVHHWQQLGSDGCTLRQHIIVRFVDYIYYLMFSETELLY